MLMLRSVTGRATTSSITTAMSLWLCLFSISTIAALRSSVRGQSAVDDYSTRATSFTSTVFMEYTSTALDSFQDDDADSTSIHGTSATSSLASEERMALEEAFRETYNRLSLQAARDSTSSGSSSGSSSGNSRVQKATIVKTTGLSHDHESRTEGPHPLAKEADLAGNRHQLQWSIQASCETELGCSRRLFDEASPSPRDFQDAYHQKLGITQHRHLLQEEQQQQSRQRHTQELVEATAFECPSDTSSFTSRFYLTVDALSSLEMDLELDRELWISMIQTTYNSLSFYTCDAPHFRTLVDVQVREQKPSSTSTSSGTPSSVVRHFPGERRHLQQPSNATTSTTARTLEFAVVAECRGDCEGLESIFAVASQQEPSLLPLTWQPPSWTDLQGQSSSLRQASDDTCYCAAEHVQDDSLQLTPEIFVEALQSTLQRVQQEGLMGSVQDIAAIAEVQDQDCQAAPTVFETRVLLEVVASGVDYYYTDDANNYTDSSLDTPLELGRKFKDVYNALAFAFCDSAFYRIRDVALDMVDTTVRQVAFVLQVECQGCDAIAGNASAIFYHPNANNETWVDNTTALVPAPEEACLCPVVTSRDELPRTYRPPTTEEVLVVLQEQLEEEEVTMLHQVEAFDCSPPPSLPPINATVVGNETIVVKEGLNLYESQEELNNVTGRVPSRWSSRRDLQSEGRRNSTNGTLTGLGFDDGLADTRGTTVFRVGVDCRRCENTEDSETFGLFDSFERRQRHLETEGDGDADLKELILPWITNAKPFLSPDSASRRDREEPETCFCPLGTEPDEIAPLTEVVFEETFSARVDQLVNESVVRSVQAVVDVEEDEDFCSNLLVEVDIEYVLDFEGGDVSRYTTEDFERAITETLRKLRTSKCDPYLIRVNSVEILSVGGDGLRRRDLVEGDGATRVLYDLTVAEAEESFLDFMEGRLGDMEYLIVQQLSAQARAGDDISVNQVGPSSPTTEAPTLPPTEAPTEPPTPSPTSSPTKQPTRSPTANPTRQPTPNPTSQPTRQPTPNPTAQPTRQPTPNPTAQPTRQPTPNPTSQPTRSPTPNPTAQPTRPPTQDPTLAPTPDPTPDPTTPPTREPSNAPSIAPSSNPSGSSSPSSSPTISKHPSMMPSRSIAPSESPTFSPGPSSSPSKLPSARPSSSSLPSNIPSQEPSASPSALPSEQPSIAPSEAPSGSPTPSSNPSVSVFPSLVPSAPPSETPSALPSKEPSVSPSSAPSDSMAPSIAPSANPSAVPSTTPSGHPSSGPSSVPSLSPSTVPSGSPSVAPSTVPTTSPTKAPTDPPTPSPTEAPTNPPTPSPTKAPTDPPTPSPTEAPTNPPTPSPTEAPTNPPTPPTNKTPNRATNPSPTIHQQSLQQPTNGSPTLPPTNQPTDPPTEPPTNPPTEPPTNPRPPTDPPTHPQRTSQLTPTEPPTNPPTLPPTNSQLITNRASNEPTNGSANTTPNEPAN
ncbi:laminin G sub domain 2 [Seminavis robusta]|uniref:Laminin G sub domain 2 n=1 Tax=Seminavis robusta TaxID=568900 RepID=A0A9N8DDW6_9STRA|nr:laminin G sub domain 2 [Seminavis robusta]|eukprot:Sro48_g028360.1 laminin G sub domain 2 (1460) ;mRNA; f:116750-121300